MLRLLLTVFICVRGITAIEDDYLMESEASCKSSRNVFSCGKYSILRFLDVASSENVVITNASSTVQLVKINDPDEAETFFPEARGMKGTDELSKLLRFMQARTDRFLRSQGVSIPLPGGFRVIEEGKTEVEGRGHHKKRGVISLLTLLGVFKLKVLIGLVLLGIFFIKKVILLSALILPSVLHNLKMSCKHIFPAHHGGGGHGEEYHDDSIYGNYGHSAGYSKDWERRYKNAQSGLATQDIAG